MLEKGCTRFDKYHVWWVVNMVRWQKPFRNNKKSKKSLRAKMKILNIYPCGESKSDSYLNLKSDHKRVWSFASCMRRDWAKWNILLLAMKLASRKSPPCSYIIHNESAKSCLRGAFLESNIWFWKERPLWNMALTTFCQFLTYLTIFENLINFWRF